MGRTVRFSKMNETMDISKSFELQAVDLVLERDYFSDRQSAEWGILAEEAPFGRLKIPFALDSHARKRFLVVHIHLYQLKARLKGLNQICTTYSSLFKQVTLIHGKDYCFLSSIFKKQIRRENSKFKSMVLCRDNYHITIATHSFLLTYARRSRQEAE